MNSSTVVQVQNLRKTYGRTVAVDDLSFEVLEGEIFGLIGPNGAGKTTTMECATGLRRLDQGTISVLSRDPWKDSQELQNHVGVQLQEAHLQKRIKVWEAVDLWAALYPRTVDIDGLLGRLGLAEKRDAWFMTLSGGQKQRLFIALALIHDPQLVFLDELTTGLDPQSRRAIWSVITRIRDQGKTVVLTTHLMEEAERLCDRVAIIEHGKVIDMDTPSALVKKHCPQRTVIFSSDWTGDAADFSSVTGLTNTSHQDDTYTLTGLGDEFVTQIIHFISERAIRISDFRTELPTLEDVFLELTGRTIRD